MNNFSTNQPYDPHGYKEEVKIKYGSVRAIVEKFPNGTAVMMVLMAAETIPLDWAAYCALIPDKQLAWEEKGNELTKAILSLISLLIFLFQ